MNENKFFIWDSKWDVACIGSNSETLAFSVEHFINCAKEAITKKGCFTVALSGGSTPQAIYKLLCSEKYLSSVDWQKCFFFWSDERAVAPTSSESNFFSAMESGLKKLNTPAKQIHRMEAEQDISANAQKYEVLINNILGTDPFDLIMLGMGDDGHTASLFPGTKALDEQNRLVCANYVPQKKVWRMTFTYRCINSAENIVIYVLGNSKAQTLEKVFITEKDQFPISHVGTNKNKALWVMDNDACALIKKHKNNTH